MRMRSPYAKGADSSAEWPFSSNCRIGSGFSMQGCTSNPWQPIEEDALESGSWNNVLNDYSRDVRSKSEYEGLINSAVEVEGRAFGNHAGGSVKAMRQMKMFSDTTAFVLGANRIVQTTRVKHPQQLKLTSSAKKLLKKNPKGFLSRYGTHYVRGILQGGFFLGSVTVNSASKDSDASVEAFASFSYDKIFSAEGTASFDAERKEHSESVSTELQVQFKGGTVTTAAKEPAEVSAQFDEWIASGAEDPVNIRMTLGSWLDSDDVIKVLGDNVHVFEDVSILPTTLELVSKEYEKCRELMNQAYRVKRWAGPNEIPCAKKVVGSMEAIMVDFEGLTDGEISALQEEGVTGGLAQRFQYDENKEALDQCRPKPCERPPGWCTHQGVTFSKVDCDGDGVAEDLLCESSGYPIQRGCISRVQGQCLDSWPALGGSQALYTIQVMARSDYSFLSMNKNNKYIELTATVSDDGWQRWSIVPNAKCEWFNIMTFKNNVVDGFLSVTGGTRLQVKNSGTPAKFQIVKKGQDRFGNDLYNIKAIGTSKPYLSVQSMGTLVDLWKKDGGKGFQSWKIYGFKLESYRPCR